MTEMAEGKTVRLQTAFCQPRKQRVQRCKSALESPALSPWRWHAWRAGSPWASCVTLEHSSTLLSGRLLAAQAQSTEAVLGNAQLRAPAGGLGCSTLMKESFYPCWARSGSAAPELSLSLSEHMLACKLWGCSACFDLWTGLEVHLISI